MTSLRMLPRAVSAPLVLLLLMLTVLATACGASGGDDDDGDAGGMTAPPQTNADTTGAGQATTEQPTGGTTGAPGAPVDGASVPDRTAQGEWNRLVIRNASVTLAVGDVAMAMNRVRDLAVSKGGFVSASSSHVQEDRQYSQITIQVPAEQYDQTVNELRAADYVERVEAEESTSQDVSAEFVDNASRLKALREVEARFHELLAEARSLDDVLRMEYELSNIRGQIETIQGRQNYLEEVTTFSTIAVTLLPSGAAPRDQQAQTEPGFSFSHIFETAWEHSRGAIETTLIAAITIGIFGVAMLPLVGLLYLGWRIVRPRWIGRGAAAGS